MATLEDLHQQIEANKSERVELMLENNHMKRRWNQQTDEIETMRTELDMLRADFNATKSKYENLKADQVGNVQEVEHLERSLIEQGDLVAHL